MPLVKRVRSRGANMVVVANGELLFVPSGSVARWNRSLRERVERAAAREAPSNKRPRWAHYGKPLKQTMKSSADIDAATMMVHSVVGSSAHYSAYVDQGTGVHAGGSPWQAKILPPWKAKGYRFYEHTWRPGGGPNRVKPVMIDGQKGKFFFEAALEYGFRAMRIPKGAAGPRMGKALSMFPDHLANFVGNTPVDDAFKAQRDIWRRERDAAWQSERERRSLAAENRYREKKAKAAAARAQTAADLAAQREADNRAKYEASKAAAERRAEEQAAKLKAAQDRKAAGEKRREEQRERERKALALEKEIAQFESARLAAYRYMHAIEGAYPDAEVQISKDRSMIRVHYTGPDGTKLNEYFLR